MPITSQEQLDQINRALVSFAHLLNSHLLDSGDSPESIRDRAREILKGPFEPVLEPNWCERWKVDSTYKKFDSLIPTRLLRLSPRRFTCPERNEAGDPLLDDSQLDYLYDAANQLARLKSNEPLRKEVQEAQDTLLVYFRSAEINPELGLEPEAPQFVFALSGDTYEISGFGESGRFRQLKGFDHIHRLIQTPGKLVSMLELVGAGNDERIAADQRSWQPILDKKAKREIFDQLANSTTPSHPSGQWHWMVWLR